MKGGNFIKFNKLLILILIFGLILGIGCVSAADDVNLEDTSLSVSNNSCNATTFKELSDFIKTHDVVELENDLVFQESRVYVYKSVIIDGKGHTLDSKGQSRIFEVEGGTLTLKNMKLINGVGGKALLDSKYGGAIRSKGNVVCINCTFDNNFAYDQGGAIWCDKYVTCINCTFTGNHVEDFGGAIYSEGGVECTGCVFVNNKVDTKGGAIYSKKRVIITSCNFTINGAYGDKINTCKGGAVYCEDYITSPSVFTNCNFINNVAYDYGGAIYGTNPLNIINSTFNNNRAQDNDGGAIFSMENIECSGSTFINNCADVDGGAIYSEERITVNSSNFTNNSASGDTTKQCYGGAIRSKDLLQCTNCNFINNYAYDYGGAVYANNVKVTNCLFENNEAHDNDGGAIFSDKKVECFDSIFINNRADDYGGAIYCSISNLIKKSIFIGNHANTRGGAITIWNDCGTTLQDSKFINNTASKGGAVYINSKYHNLYIHHNIFINNGMDIYARGYYKAIDHNYFGTPNPNFYGDPGIFVEWKHWPKDDLKHADSTYFKTLEDYIKYGDNIDSDYIDDIDNIDDTNNNDSSSDNAENEGIPMEHTGFPLIAILLAIFVLPLGLRKRD